MSRVTIAARAAGAALAAALLALTLPAAAARDLDKVTVGLVPTLSLAPYYVAVDKGYMAAEGIAPDESGFRGAQDSISLMATGKLDVSLGALNAGFFNAQNQGFDLRVVAALGVEPAPVIAVPLIARKELVDSGAIKTGADLKSRKVGVNTPGSQPEYLLSLVLAKYQMTIKDVDETMLSFPQMVIGLHNKAIDAAFVAEPFATRSIRDGTAALVRPEANVGAGELVTVVFFSGHFMRDRGDAPLRFLTALVRAAHETQGAYNKNPALAAIMAKATKLTPDDVTQCIAYAFDRNLDISKYTASLRREEQMNLKNGRLNYATPIDLAKVVDASLVHRAAQNVK